MSNTNTITIRAEGARAAKVERPLPDYRLVRKNGTLTLQRAYDWACGTDADSLLDGLMGGDDGGD